MTRGVLGRKNSRVFFFPGEWIPWARKNGFYLIRDATDEEEALKLKEPTFQEELEAMLMETKREKEESKPLLPISPAPKKRGKRSQRK